jgi:hypothetical protein
MPIYVILGNWTDQGTSDFGGAVRPSQRLS